MIGYEFQPGQDKRLRTSLNRPQGGGGSLSPAANEAIRILSLRLPNVLGGRPPAPEDLLKPSVGGGGEPGAVASSLLKTTAGVDRPGSLTGGPSSLSTPSLASPTSMPFATSTPNEGGALSRLVGSALGGGPGAPNVGYKEPGGKLPDQGPTMPPPTPPVPQGPTGAAPAITTAPDQSLNDLLAWLARGGMYDTGLGAGTYGSEG